MHGIQTENYFYKCCWIRCGMLLETPFESLEHWNSWHCLCRERLSDLECQANIVNILECELKHDKFKLQHITTVAKRGKNIFGIGWENKQAFLICNLDNMCIK